MALSFGLFRCCCGESISNDLQGLLSTSIGEDAVVSDTHESLG